MCRVNVYMKFSFSNFFLYVTVTNDQSVGHVNNEWLCEHLSPFAGNSYKWDLWSHAFLNNRYLGVGENLFHPNSS